ncbi:adenylate/guanylate cyclase domain-containing protein [Rothia terrae]|uniref:Adenylate/guanylate cyclase domain-containing protein n=1 Tax=Rothia terrae TaxID=396015 RepID=A0A7H2BCA5_9MICC|nr:adenylate/guanylate cyclase domain-containing protein [Rothia terrae]
MTVDEKAEEGTVNLPVTGPATTALNFLSNRVQNNVYRSDAAKAGIRELERVLLGQNRTLRRRETAESAGVSLLSARKIWRALGFPNVSDDDKYFTELDADALRRITGLVREGVVTEDGAISITRSVGQMMDRMVAWQVEALVEDMVVNGGKTDAEAREELLTILPEFIDELEEIAVYGYRRQLNAAVLRLALRAEKENSVTDQNALPLARGIGFADLVSYTSLSRQMNEKTLASLIKSFEQKCAEVVAVGGGRIIKTVGDEIMFLTESPEAGARISLALSKMIRENPDLPEARVAFVWGRVLPRLGDVYGPTVNLASRLVALAEPGVVLTDDTTAETIENDEKFVLIPQGVRNVRGFGNVSPVAITPGIGNELEIDFE